MHERPPSFSGLVLSLLLLVCPGEVAAQQSSWKFVVFGDSVSFDGSDISSNLLAELASAVVLENPSLVLFAGDFAFSGSADALQQWTNIMRPVADAGIPVLPAIGNHDVPAVIAETFGQAIPANGPPGELDTTYPLSFSNALIIVLNEFTATNSYRVNQPWLDSILATNTQPHVFACSHVPAFRLYHNDCLDNFPPNRDAFWNSLSNAHCRIYFCGHDHFYDHSRLDDGDGDFQNDLHQIVVGTGGAPLYPDIGYPGANSLWSPRRIYHEQQYGYVVVQVAADNVTTTWHHRIGPGLYAATDEIFSYSLKLQLVLRHRSSGGQLTLTWDGSAHLQASSEPDTGFADVAGANSPFVVTNFAGAQVFYRLVSPQP